MNDKELQIVQTHNDLDICVIKNSTTINPNSVILTSGGIRQEHRSSNDKEYIMVLSEDDNFIGLYKKTHREQQPKFAGEEPTEVVLWDKVY